MQAFMVLMPLSVPSRNLREKRGKVDYRIELKLAQWGLLLGEVLIMLFSVRRKATRQSTETGSPGRLWSLPLWRHPNPLPRLGFHQQVTQECVQMGFH